MKNSDLKTGMQIEQSNGKRRLVLIGCSHENRTTTLVNAQPDNVNGFNRLIDYFPLSKWNEDLTTDSSVVLDIVKIYSAYGELLWEREDIAITIDGVDYSESTLRSLIRKAINEFN